MESIEITHAKMSLLFCMFGSHCYLRLYRRRWFGRRTEFYQCIDCGDEIPAGTPCPTSGDFGSVSP